MDWITDRPPTAADADADGHVLISSPSDGRRFMTHWTNFRECHAWRHVTKQRRIVSITRTVMAIGDHTIDAVADDGTAWWMVPGEVDWTQLPALPDRG